MTSQGINISDLRPEVRSLVNFNSAKYNPNNNEKIDDGAELSLLLSEYGCSKEDLTEQSGIPMLTTEQTIQINNRSNEIRKDARKKAAVFSTLSALSTGFGLALFKKNIISKRKLLFVLGVAGVGFGIAIYEMFRKSNAQNEALKEFNSQQV